MRRVLRRVAWWILATMHPPQDEIDRALQGAFADCGLCIEHYRHDFDLVSAHKLHEVLVHACRRLGHPLTTVADVRRLLQ